MSQKKNVVWTPSLFEAEEASANDENLEFPLPDDLDASWHKALALETRQPYWSKLQEFVVAERAAHTVYPPAEDVYNAFRYTPLDEVKVFLLGQDPYPGAGQAHGLCFSVRPGVRLPGSLRNIYKELNDDLGIPPVKHGYLVSWAKQGVLLLNACLTVRAENANSHAGKGWEKFTDAALRAVKRPEANGCVPALGRVCPEEDPADRPGQARHREVSAPVASLGRQRLLRQQAVLEGERGTERRRRKADRVGVCRRKWKRSELVGLWGCGVVGL